MTTLSGTDQKEVDTELKKLFQLYATPNGGFIPVVVRWNRPSFSERMVVASVKSIQRYRKEWAI